MIATCCSIRSKQINKSVQYEYGTRCLMSFQGTERTQSRKTDELCNRFRICYCSWWKVGKETIASCKHDIGTGVLSIHRGKRASTNAYNDWVYSRSGARYSGWKDEQRWHYTPITTLWIPDYLLRDRVPRWVRKNHFRVGECSGCKTGIGSQGILVKPYN